MALHRLSDLGFSAQKVLDLMRLYDETCLALCEGQFLDIRASESQEWMSVEYYLDMIGRKTAALIAGSVQAGAMLATDDESVIARLSQLRLGPGHGLPDQRRPAGHLGRRAGDRQGGLRHRGTQADAAAAPRAGACESSPTGSALRAILHGPPPTADDVEAARAILERAGSRQFTRGRAAPPIAMRRCSSWSRRAIVDGEAMERLQRIVGIGHHGLKLPPSVVVGRGLRASAWNRWTRTLPTRRPSVVSTVSRSVSPTRTSSPTLGMPPMR